MELKMQQYKLPKKVGFNYDELKTELQAKVQQYETVIYTEDQIMLARTDRADLNRLKKALNDERIRLQKEYMIPFNEFKAQIDELIQIIAKPVGLIDLQLKDYEEREKADKFAAIEGYWKSCEKPFEIPLEMIMNPKWLNKSVTLKSVYAELDSLLETIEKDLVTLQNLPEFGFEATEVYKTSLDLGKAIQEGQKLAEIQKRKAEAEAKVVETEKQQEEPMTFQEELKAFVDAIPDPKREPICFRAYLTPDDALALRDFMDSRGIPFEAI